MKMNVHLNFSGNAREAFTFYKDVFEANQQFLFTYGEGPEGMPVPENWGDKVMHTSIPLGGGQLMGCDAPTDRRSPMGGFQVAVESTDQDEVRRLYAALREGGSEQMPLTPSFWSPLFGMCTDKFGVAWMISVPGDASQA